VFSRTPASAGQFGTHVPLPRFGAGLTVARRRSGFVVVAIGLPTLTAVLVSIRNAISLDSVLLLYLLAVVVVSVVGGMWPALVAAVSSFVLANWFLTEPYYTFHVESRDSVIALVVFVVVAVTVSVIVDLSARRLLTATRSRLEAEMLSEFTSQPVADASLMATLQLIRSSFEMDAVALVERSEEGERVIEVAGSLNTDTRPSLSVEAGSGLFVVAQGPPLFAEDHRMLQSLAATAARAWEAQQLAAEAAQSIQLAAIDRLRSSLLAAVGHDLRTPLSGIKAAASSLRQHDVSWTPTQQDELLATIEESADRLDDLVSNLLAMSRLQAGALSVDLVPTALDEVAARAVMGIHGSAVELMVPDDLPLALADPGLLERVVANLVDNALRHAPDGTRVVVDGVEADPATVRLRVVDRGPGLPETDWEGMFAPFQRFDDRGTGNVGLGLAIARGFLTAMNASVAPSRTPGGGLTMTITLPVAR
jgi:K+-sensing histidine kinase KdpD